MTERVWELGKFYRFKYGGERKHECVFIARDGSVILQTEEKPPSFCIKFSISLWEEVKPVHKVYVVITRSLGKIYSFSSVSKREVEDYLSVNSVECLSDIKEIEIEEK